MFVLMCCLRSEGMACSMSFCGTSEALAEEDATPPEKPPSYEVNASLMACLDCWPASLCVLVSFYHQHDTA